MTQAEELEKRLAAGEARVGVLGLGYVGLPVALSFAEAGLSVLGFDIDAKKIDQLLAGSCYVRHLAEGRLEKALQSQRFTPSSDFSRLREADVVVICVPTPLDVHRQPDLSYVAATARQIAETLRPGQLVILESTTYPGTTQELLVPALAAGGLSCGDDFFVAFSPEREDPGNESFSTTDIPKVIGGVDDVSGDLAERFYRIAFPRVHRVRSAREAEATKLTENIFRAVNIALVNELKVVYDSMGIDVWEVLDAAETKPFGFMRFNPGPGWGGHCIPVDPFYLSWKAREFGTSPRFIELAGQVNIEMPQFVIHKLQLALNERTKAVKGSRILILGLAYKKDIDDPRESPAFEVIDLLLELGADVTYHDPYVDRAPAMRSWPELPPMTSQELTDQVLQEADAVVLITAHQKIDYERIARLAPLIIDTRGVFPAAAAHVVRA